MLSTSPLGTCPWDALSTWSYSPVPLRSGGRGKLRLNLLLLEVTERQTR